MKLLVAAMIAVASTAARADFTDNVIKIGVLNDQSGLYADLAGQGSVDAAKMAVEEFGGKIGNTPIEVIFADHQNKPDIGANIARQWIDVDHVDAIVDVPTSSVALAVAKVVKEKNKVFLANGTAKTMVGQGGKTWFFLTADYAFGTQLQEAATKVVEASGGKVVGAVRVPLSTSDFSSYLLQAQNSGAQVLGLANAGNDFTNSIKAADEFGIGKSMKPAALLAFISDIHSLGLKTAQGLYLTTGWYWDLNDKTRAFAKRYYAKTQREPTMNQAGYYSATMTYLNAVKAVGSTDSDKVMAEMKKMKIDDMFTSNGKIRADGLMEHEMYIMQVKKPEESKAPWDYYRLVQTMSGEEAFGKLSESACPLVASH